MRRYTSRHIARIYPAGYRVDSSNYDPQDELMCPQVSICVQICVHMCVHMGVNMGVHMCVHMCHARVFPGLFE